jgi:protein Jumonji
MPRTAQDRVSKLDSIYCKYLLPYATLSNDERKKLLHKVDIKNNRRSNKDDEEDECVVKGSSLALSNFYRIARNTMSVWFPHAVGSASTDSVPYVDPEQVQPYFLVS